MPQRPHGKRSARLRVWTKRLHQLFIVGSWIVALMYGIDPNWPSNFRRLVVLIAIWIRGSLGYLRK